jgi:hypothetical protein
LTDRFDRHVAATWGRQVLRSLTPASGVTRGGPAVVQVMGRLVSLDAQPAPARRLPRSPEERSDLLATWARSGRLTYGDAELLMALDETTAWKH